MNKENIDKLKSLPKPNILEMIIPFYTIGDVNHLYSDNQYDWYYALSESLKPNRYLEIGVYAGYSAIVTFFGNKELESMHLYDNSSYGAKLSDAIETIEKAGFVGEIFSLDCDTQSINELDIGNVDYKFDFIHVDGDHSYKGALHDLELVLPLLSENGIIVVDDITYEKDVDWATSDFLSSHPELDYIFIDSFRGHRIIYKK